MTDLVFVLFGGVVAVAGLRIVARRAGTVWTPAHAFSIAWAAMLVASELALDGALAPSTPTLLVLILAWWAFIAGTVLVLARRSRTPPPVERGLRPNTTIVTIAVLVALEAAGAYFELHANLASGLPSSVDELAAMRVTRELATDAIPFPLSLFRWAHVLYVPLAISLFAQRRTSHLVWILPALASVALGSLKFTRAPLFQIAVIGLWCWYTMLRPSRRTWTTVAAATAGIVAVVFALSQELLISVDRLALSDTREAMWSYFAAPAKAYGILLESPDLFGSDAPLSLAFVHLPLEKLGLVDGVVRLSRPFISVPITTNLYTFLDAYTVDAGILGAIVGALATGALATAITGRAVRTRRVGALVVAAYILYCSVMAPANNEFVRPALPIYAVLAWLLDRLVTQPPPRGASAAPDSEPARERGAPRRRPRRSELTPRCGAMRPA